MAKTLSKDESLTWTKITRVILIVGILGISGAIIYTLSLPEEEDLLFFLLNENQSMSDYPTNVTVNGSLTFYIYIHNMRLEDHEYQVNCYQGDLNGTIDPMKSVANNQDFVQIASQTTDLNYTQEWISNPFDIIFQEIGNDQRLVFELWVNRDGVWEFIPDYVLTLNIDVLPLS